MFILSTHFKQIALSWITVQFMTDLKIRKLVHNFYLNAYTIST